MAGRYKSESLLSFQKEAKVLMCAYKVVTIRTKIFGLQTRLENWIMDFERDIFLRFHKQVGYPIDL